MLLLGIESSCDETSAAVVRDGREILSNVVASQHEVHRPYGGVVPELASRQHLRQVAPIVDAALKEASVDVSELDGIAVTRGPGLVGSLLVGLSFGKAMAFARNLPLIGVDHLEGHIRAAYLESAEPVPHPAVSLVVSGGHTSLFHMKEELSYELIGKTRDDAAGEAYDKVAKRLGLGYPGGPVIDRLAARGDGARFRFSPARFSDGSQDFSFSGLKSAVLRTIQEHPVPPLAEGEDASSRQDVCDLAASFQRTVVRSLVQRTKSAVTRFRARAVLVSGGVAANRELRAEFEALGRELGVPVVLPTIALSTDNAAMIAAAGYLRLKRDGADAMDLNADVELRLGESGDRRARRHL